MGLCFYIYIQGLAQQPEVHLQRLVAGRSGRNIPFVYAMVISSPDYTHLNFLCIIYFIIFHQFQLKSISVFLHDLGVGSFSLTIAYQPTQWMLSLTRKRCCLYIPFRFPIYSVLGHNTLLTLTNYLDSKLSTFTNHLR